jgi:predicted nucleotidyltransferase
MRSSKRHDNLEFDVGKALAQIPGIAAAYVYGSAARGVDTPLSDIDVALVASDDLRAEERGQLLRTTITVLERRQRGTTVDVRFLDELPAAIAGRVVGEGILVFERDANTRLRAEVKARMLYHDFLPFEKVGTRDGIAGLRKRLNLG